MRPLLAGGGFGSAARRLHIHELSVPECCESFASDRLIFRSLWRHAQTSRYSLKRPPFALIDRRIISEHKKKKVYIERATKLSYSYR